jgi:hypothetical protein
MSKSYRVRTQVGVDKSVTVNLEQDFDFLEILSLKLSQSEIYVRQCSDYGVIAGRVSVNDGYGVPNAKLSLFIPISAADELNPTISEIYPYKTVTDVNEDGYRYNLLPYKPSFPGHSATGSFPDLEDVLKNPTAIELYDKYYKFTVTTNDSGDFMIFGVPVGSYTILMNLDLSDMGPFSQSPQDLIRLGIATESQVNGTKFQTSENLTTLPQIIFLNKTVEVLPLWGEPEICQPSITRTDFDLTAEASITIKPTAIFMGSIISDTDESALRRNCKPIKKSGYQCNLISGPGQILSIRQTINQDINGRPVLEEHEFENNGKVIDPDGTWLLDVPMNLDYIITNEFGEQIFSNDEKKGIPTKSKYRFKVKWNQSPGLGEPIKRANFLVPNVKENGWDGNRPNQDPLIDVISTSGGYIAAKKSYAFSLDWNDYGYSASTYGDDIIQEAINCEDKFYEMSYNKVYTISQLITRFTKGNRQRQYLGIKNITDEACESTSNKFPTNEAQYRFDLLFLLFVIASSFISIILKIVVIIFHVICAVLQAIIEFADKAGFNKLKNKIIQIQSNFNNLNIPLFTFPDCELCSCKSTKNNISNYGPDYSPPLFTNNSILADIIDQTLYDVNTDDEQSIDAIQRFSAGFVSTNLAYSYAFRTPQRANLTDDQFIWTQSLTVPESLNLMNFKGKFFGIGGGSTNETSSLNKRIDPSGPYALGGGTNQIKSTFNTTANDFNTTFHYDNLMILMIEEKIPDGTILTFNNPYDGVDVNMSATTQLNAYGTYSVTGNPINTGGAINVSYTEPINGYRGVVTYNMTQTDTDSDRYLKYPTGIEYFQVIKTMTYDEYKDLIASLFGMDNGRGPESIANRVFDASSLISQSYVTNIIGLTQPWADINWWNGYSDKSNAFITLMVRGVDPHSSRIPIKYGIGRLFGRTNHWDISVEGDFKMNIPLQPNDGLDFGQITTGNAQFIASQNAHRCVDHLSINTNDEVDTGYSQGRIFFPSYHFQPTQWTPFPTFRISNYSSLDENSNLNNYAPGGTPSAMFSSIQSYTFIGNINGTTGGGLRVGSDNMYARKPGSHIDNPLVFGYCDFPSNNGEQFNNKRYAIGESVEGGSMIGMKSTILTLNGGGKDALGSVYFAPKYPNWYNTTMSDSNRIVMRTDRMPTSDIFQTFNTNNSNAPQVPQGMTIMSNGQFTIYELSDDGVVAGADPAAGTPAFPGDDPDVPISGSTDPESFGSVDKVLATFSCEHLVPIDCYITDPPDSITVDNEGTCQYYTSGGYARYFIGGSCYSLVHPNYLGSHLKKDLQLITEWLSRMNINFGACREVFSHTFINNWVNGVLYAFPFKTVRYFTGPDENPPNQPYNKYCKDTIFLDPDTFNFYYRSAPYDESNGRFIGKKGFERNDKIVGNERNLMFPTTMIDLGPRDELQKFLSQSGNWDGYIMNKLNTTTFGDTSDILNLFILSRFANTSFGALFKRPEGASIMNYFSRDKRFVDADFAQMIATNSQFGIAAFEPANYPEPPSGDTIHNSPLYFPGGVANVNDITFGIFYTGDSQVRDYISPNRTIYNPNGTIGVNDDCSFTYIPVTTQSVPFYLWNIKDNTGNPNIFGTQKNDWYFGGGANGTAFQYGYQKIDRLYSASKNFQPSPNITQINYHKGWIYNVDDNLINPVTGELDYKPEPGIPEKYLTGAPFYFYFGLSKGASAFDRFTTKWIDTDAFVE